jgi:hypothetical protein
MPYEGHTTLTRLLDDAAMAAFAAHIQPGGPLLFGELRHLGGAVGRVPAGAGAAGSVDGEYLFFTGGLVMSPELGAAVHEAGRAAVAALAPYATGAGYLNFTEHPTDPSRFYSDDAYGRIRAVRAAIDPDSVMVSNHPVPAA